MIIGQTVSARPVRLPAVPRFLTMLVSLQNQYDATFPKMVYECPVMQVAELMREDRPEVKAVRVEYNDKPSFKILVKQLGIMDDTKVRQSFTFSSLYRRYSNSYNFQTVFFFRLPFRMLQRRTYTCRQKKLPLSNKSSMSSAFFFKVTLSKFQFFLHMLQNV